MRTRVLGVAVVVAALSLAACGGDTGEGSEGATTVTTTENVTVTETVTAEAEAAAEPVTETVTQTVTETVAAEPSEEAAAEETDSDSGDGSYTAGDFAFNDVQVTSDWVDDFEIRTRATNNGTSVEAASFTATLFNEGSVVGTADAYVSDWVSGETVTVEFVSVDEYTDWDDIEFQVDHTF